MNKYFLVKNESDRIVQLIFFPKKIFWKLFWRDTNKSIFYSASETQSSKMNRVNRLQRTLCIFTAYSVSRTRNRDLCHDFISQIPTRLSRPVIVLRDYVISRCTVCTNNRHATPASLCPEITRDSHCYVSDKKMIILSTDAYSSSSNLAWKRRENAKNNVEDSCKREYWQTIYKFDRRANWLIFLNLFLIKYLLYCIMILQIQLHTQWDHILE